MSFGIASLEYITTPFQERGPDPFDKIFPKMTKCTMRTYGPSGTLQTHDALCVMGCNVLNEKIYFLVWFVFWALLIFTAIHHVIASIILLSK